MKRAKINEKRPGLANFKKPSKSAVNLTSAKQLNKTGQTGGPLYSDSKCFSIPINVQSISADYKQSYICLKAHSHNMHLMCPVAAEGCIDAEIGKFLIFRTTPTTCIKRMSCE